MWLWPAAAYAPMAMSAEGMRPDVPPWVPRRLYPFQSRWAQIGGADVHYVDEGDGPPLLMLHGNPTWSLLYREIILGLRDRFRCIALDYPGFGLSRAPAGYGFTPAEHSAIVERFVGELDLRETTMMAQDWGGPIGFAVAGRQPQRFAAFVIGNTWAWPKSDLATLAFSRLLGGPLGAGLILRHNIFVERILPGNVMPRRLSGEVMGAYRGPFPTPESRRPVHVFPREIIASRQLLTEVEAGLARLRDRPVLIVWGTRDPIFGGRDRRRFQQLFPDHRTVMLRGAGHYIQEAAPEGIVAAIREWRHAAPG